VTHRPTLDFGSAARWGATGRRRRQPPRCETGFHHCPLTLINAVGISSVRAFALRLPAPAGDAERPAGRGTIHRPGQAASRGRGRGDAQRAYLFSRSSSRAIHAMTASKPSGASRGRLCLNPLFLLPPPACSTDQRGSTSALPYLRARGTTASATSFTLAIFPRKQGPETLSIISALACPRSRSDRVESDPFLAYSMAALIMAQTGLPLRSPTAAFTLDRLVGERSGDAHNRAACCFSICATASCVM
jgi:hypothetical protein